jgi:hypothetical protein
MSGGGVFVGRTTGADGVVDGKVRAALVGALILLGYSALAGGPGGDDDSVELILDGSRSVGVIRPLHGVNSGPVTQGGTLDLSPAFREIAPPLVRLHDCHWPNPDVVDIHVLFPDARADPTLPESYDFARTDEYVQATLDVGSRLVFRLGESIEHTRTKRYVHPPKDPAKWAAVCVGVIRHYNEGWAGGSRDHIRYWEVWNEPDNRPAMWTGSDEDYFRLYSAAAKAIKGRFPDVRVGGPGLGNTGRLEGDRLDPAPFLRRFLEHCRRDAAPLDFFSWHCYTSDPAAVARRARAVRRLLDESGFPEAESHLNEWNYLPDEDWAPMLSADARARQRWHERVGGAEGAAFAAATLLRLQDAPVDAANYYSADAQGMGLFNGYGVPRKSFYALKAFRALADTPVRLALRGELPRGTAACAGMSKSRSQVTLLLSKDRGADERATVRLSNLPWEGATQYEVSLVDGQHDLPVVQSGRCAAGGSLTQDLRAPSVCLVRLRPARTGE